MKVMERAYYALVISNQTNLRREENQRGRLKQLSWWMSMTRLCKMRFRRRRMLTRRQTTILEGTIWGIWVYTQIKLVSVWLCLQIIQHNNWDRTLQKWRVMQVSGALKLMIILRLWRTIYACKMMIRLQLKSKEQRCSWMMTKFKDSIKTHKIQRQAKETQCRLTTWKDTSITKVPMR